MQLEIAEINENTFIQGATLCEAISKFGNPELIKAYNDTISMGVIKNEKTSEGFLGVLQNATLALSELQNNKYRREEIYSELHKGILALIKRGDLMPYGFKEPRNIQDKPIKIPVDLFFSGQINWDNSELKSKTLEFTGIRLLADLLPVIDLKPEKSEFQEIKRIGNSKLNKSKKSNFSDLDPELHIDEKEAAKLLGISYRTLQGYRVKGGGPKFRKIGKKSVRYKIADLIEWSEENKKENTSQN